MTPLASIITVLYGGRPITERYLASLEAALGHKLGSDFELILVDNNSPDDTGELLDAWEDRATVLRQPENLNFGGGNNVGAAVARGDVLLLVNNDTEIPPGTLEALAATVADPGVVAAGCRLLYPEGSLQHGGMAFVAHPLGVAHPFHLFRHEAGDLPVARGVVDVSAVTGAVLAIRRELFEQLDGFDEVFVNGWEDTDLLLRGQVATDGGRVVYRGDVAAVHHEGLTRGTTIHDQENFDAFYARWGEMLDPDESMVATAFGGRFSPYGQFLNYQGDAPEGSMLGITGALLGIGAESDEARALLYTALRAELRPAAREAPIATVTPTFDAQEWQLLDIGHHQMRNPDAVVVTVPVGRFKQPPGGPRAVLRLARMPAAGVDAEAFVIAASRELADALVATAHPADRVVVLRPTIAASVGGGGGGILALLPAHDRELAQSVLGILAAAPSGIPIRLLPSVGGPVAAELAETGLPHAELLAPVSTESGFTALAGSSDVVVAIDPDDPYGRRPLTAAAAGAAVVARAGGVAGEVLGDMLHVSVADALADSTPREERAAAVAGECGPEGVAALFKEIYEGLLAERPAQPAFDLRLISPDQG